MKLSVQQVQDFYDAHEQNKTDNFLKNHSKPVLRLLNECLGVKGNDVVKCLKKSKDVLEKVRTKYTNPNTIKFYLQSLIWLIDKYPGLYAAVPRDVYFKAWEASKVGMIEHRNTQKETQPYIPYSEIQEKVDAKYGAPSMESLFVSFYKEVPARLDFYDIMVDDETADKHLVLKTGTLVMKKYNKTSDKHGVKEIKLSKELMTKIKASLKERPRSELIVFSNRNASKAVVNLLGGAGVQGSLNTLRHSIMSDPKITPEERVELAHKAGHKVETNMDYIRKN